jgi:hypothetical protein
MAKNFEDGRRRSAQVLRNRVTGQTAADAGCAGQTEVWKGLDVYVARLISAMERYFLTPGENFRGLVRRAKAQRLDIARNNSGSPARRQMGWFSSSTVRNFFTGIFPYSSSRKPKRSFSIWASSRSLRRTVSFFIVYKVRA